MWERATPEERDNARHDAIEICLPSFVPILVAAQRGRADLWQEAINPLRTLVLLRDRVRAGVRDVFEIGSHMLYFVGNLGFGIAARGKQLALIQSWMRLPMPATDYGQASENTWLGMIDAHRLWGQCTPGNSAPFQDILRVCESDYISGFIGDAERFCKCLFLGNLAQSLFELGQWIEDKEHLRALESGDSHRLAGDLAVWPVWSLMEPDQFRSATWELFDSAEGIRQFVFAGDSTPLERFWGLWKKWKAVCVWAPWPLDTQVRIARLGRLEGLVLPGEPQGR